METKDISTEQCLLAGLRDLSARIGQDPLLVQASSGNTSIKIGDVLWIKASGKWLKHAESDGFLVPVGLTRARRCAKEDAVLPESDCKLAGGVCASIETGMHALLPWKVVVHVHSVNTIAWTLQENGLRELSTRLSGLHWQWIPYTPSGNPLARKVDQIVAGFPENNVLVLGNHGLVVCGDDCESAEKLLAEVERRVAIEPRPTGEYDPFLEQRRHSLPGPGWFVPASAAVHALALDPVSRRILSGGVLYPCQAIFLPGTVPGLACVLGQNSYAVEREECESQKLLLLEGQGVLCSKNITRAEHEMLVGLADVVQRIRPTESIRYLTDSEVVDVLTGGGEHYRQVADTSCYSTSMVPGS